MKRKDRLLATLSGDKVDRPAVSFYEINGLDEKPFDSDSFNIYSHPTWYPLIDLAKEKSDRIVMRTVSFPENGTDPFLGNKSIEVWFDGQRKFEKTIIRTRRGTLSSTTMRDPDVNTTWQVEYLLKDMEDLKDILDLPFNPPFGFPDIESVYQAEEELGDSGIVMIDTPDPLCVAASFFDLGTYTIIASQQEELFTQLLQKISEAVYYYVQLISQSLPGRLWRIYGPEYASPPYLHPRLFEQYVVNFDLPIVDMIHETKGFARLHSHGHLRLILNDIARLKVDGLDPIEPPPQGDVDLIYVREKYGDQWILFGNLEASDLEILPTSEFEVKIRSALREGTKGDGRGFVLMPSSCPYGRVLPRQALENYQKMIDIVESGDY